MKIDKISPFTIKMQLEASGTPACFGMPLKPPTQTQLPAHSLPGIWLRFQVN